MIQFFWGVFVFGRSLLSVLIGLLIGLHRMKKRGDDKQQQPQQRVLVLRRHHDHRPQEPFVHKIFLERTVCKWS